MIFFLRYNSVDVNVAVATDAGLITPIIFKADTKVSTIQMLKSFHEVVQYQVMCRK